MKYTTLKTILKTCLLIAIVATTVTVIRIISNLINNQFEIINIFNLIIDLICSFICYMNYRYFKKEF